MKRFVHIIIPATTLLMVLLGQPAFAVIVGGTSGTGNNNNTQAGLDDYLASASQPAFSYWDNLIRVSNASGVYLGFNASTGTGWVLSANHINPTPTSISVAGNSYGVVRGERIGSSDLKLYEIGGGIGDPALPSLPSVPLASAAAGIDDFVLMFGRGFTNNTSAPYSWATPGTNDANGMRWGTNTVEANAVVSGNPYIVVAFDGPNDPGATAFDAQGSIGDSGGGLFIFRNGQWEVSGIAHFVDPGTASGTNPSQYGNLTAYTDVNSFETQITGFTGTLIPEPSAMLLLLSSGAFLLRRRTD